MYSIQLLIAEFLDCSSVILTIHQFSFIQLTCGTMILRLQLQCWNCLPS